MLLNYDVVLGQEKTKDKRKYLHISVIMKNTKNVEVFQGFVIVMPEDKWVFEGGSYGRRMCCTVCGNVYLFRLYTLHINNIFWFSYVIVTYFVLWTLVFGWVYM